MKKTLTLWIDNAVWKQYQKLCLDRGKRASVYVEQFMIKELNDSVNQVQI